MLQALSYPFDLATILRKRKSIREALLQGDLHEVRVAILGGATSSELKQQLEIFLLAEGLRPTFYESDFNRYFEEVMLDSARLREFGPQFVVLYTSSRNIGAWPAAQATQDEAEQLVAAEVSRLELMWDRLLGEHSCCVIQPNFEPLPLRSSGHRDASSPGGRQAFIASLNARLANAAAAKRGVVLLDVAHLSATVGLDAWHSAEHWYGYKLPSSPLGTVTTAHALARSICGSLGRSRKCIVLDLDNTLWGGVIGDDGIAGIKLGRDNAIGEAYLDFQAYCLELKARGILLAVASKNDPARAREGFQHPDSLLKVEDFSAFVANWDPKDQSLRLIADQLRIGLDSLVFVDDNPAERALVRGQLPQVKVPEIGADVSDYARIIERNLYFEKAELSEEDQKRSAYYAADRHREDARGEFASYDEYLFALRMRAEVGTFSEGYLTRIVQLINKTNQFNLTTRRYTSPEVSALLQSERHLGLWGRLADRFGDNGLVSVVLGEQRGDEFHLDLWLMSCRVLKRSFEHVMLDTLVERLQRRGVRRLVGYYKRTEKNDMVAEHYARLGFVLSERVGETESKWVLDLESPYVLRNTVIKEIVSHE